MAAHRVNEPVIYDGERELMMDGTNLRVRSRRGLGIAGGRPLARAQ